MTDGYHSAVAEVDQLRPDGIPGLPDWDTDSAITCESLCTIFSSTDWHRPNPKPSGLAGDADLVGEVFVTTSDVAAIGAVQDARRCTLLQEAAEGLIEGSSDELFGVAARGQFGAAG